MRGSRQLAQSVSEGQDSDTEKPGRKLKNARERLHLRYRDVEKASFRIARRHDNNEFLVSVTRLTDIENRGTMPSLLRLYTLCATYRLDMYEVLAWYGADISSLAADAASVPLEHTHPIGFKPGAKGEVALPLLDAGIDLRRTSYLSRMIRRWGVLPLALLDGMNQAARRYAFIGTEDWTMYPLLNPGALVIIDESKRKVEKMGWTNEFNRPIYFLEHRAGFACGWCTVNEGKLVIQPHPVSLCKPEVYKYPEEIDVVGQLSGVAMHLGSGRPRRIHA